MDEISKPKREEKWLSLPQAAEYLGRARQTVATLAASGELKSDWVAGRLVIDRESAEALKAAA